MYSRLTKNQVQCLLKFIDFLATLSIAPHYIVIWELRPMYYIDAEYSMMFGESPATYAISIRDDMHGSANVIIAISEGDELD